MARQARQFYEFGPYRVDPLKRLLLRDSEPVSLTPKAFDILLALIENQGETLGKDELMRRVWPDTVVEENNLTRNISSLRKALGEHPNEREYVATIHGYGYRFVAEVNESFPYAGMETAALNTEPDARSFLSKVTSTRKGAVFAVAILAIAAIGIAFLRDRFA